MKIFLMTLAIFITIAGCGENEVSNKGIVQQISGAYSGVLPCGDCEAINYEIELNDDMTYKERMIYVGKTEKPHSATGRWKVEGTNKVIVYKKSDELSQFEFSKGSLIMLDASGKKIEGPTAEKFVLKPGGIQFLLDSNDHTPLMKLDSTMKRVDDTTADNSEPEIKTPADTTAKIKAPEHSTSINGLWKLIEINGMKPDEGNYMTGIPDLNIRQNDNKFSCNAGCNRVNGAVQIRDTLISFSKFFSTRMTCPGTGEKEYISTMTAVDSYTIENGVLNLKSAGKTILKYSR